ncbi:MAG TPA: hypothetical protein VIK78_00525 [Ruminiclostridium sp.]
MTGFYLLVAVSSLISVLITFFLGRFFEKRAIVKYIPAIIIALAVIGFFIKSRFFSTGFEDLAYIVLALIAGIVFVVSLITAFIMDLLQRRNRRK